MFNFKAQAERKALAAKRLAAHKAGKTVYTQQATQQTPQQAAQGMSETQEARLIDRGLIAWWE